MRGRDRGKKTGAEKETGAEEAECLGEQEQEKEKGDIRSLVEATDNTDDTDNPEAEEDDGLKISLNVLLALGGEAVTAVRSSSSQSSISVLISSKYFTSSLGGREGRKRI